MKILVVDDDPHILALTSEVLASGGYDVIEASTGKDALGVVAVAHPDLVVLDVVLTDMSGFEVCKEIKTDPVLHSTFVVLHSGVSTSSEAQTTGLDIGADGYIVKGTPSSELLARVNSLLRIKKAEDALQRANDELDQRVKARTAELMGANQRLIASEKSLLERLRFERLLSELAAMSINVSPAGLDREVEDALKAIVDFFHVSRCVLIKGFPEEQRAVITYDAHVGDSSSAPIEIDAVPLFPWSSTALQRGEVVRLNKLDDLPAAGRVDKETYRKSGVRSILAIPLSVGGLARYIISISSSGEERAWPEEYVPQLQMMGEILINTLERKRAKVQLEERLQFETLLAGISAHFVSLPADQIDNKIEDGQQRICELLELDRSTLWQFSEIDPETQFLLTHRYEGSEMQVHTGLHARDLFPWAAQKVLSGETLAVSTMDDLPPEAARDRDSWRQYGTKSALVIPLLAGAGTILGAVSFAQTRGERDWPETVVKYLQLIAQVFANALSRKRADQTLRESEARYRLLAENVKDVIWTMDMDGHFTYVSPSVMNLRGFTAQEAMRQTLDEALTPDSARRAREALEHLYVTGDTNAHLQRLEMEQPRKDGSTVWTEVDTSIIRDGEEKPTGVVGVSRDISEHRRMDAELRKRLEEIESLKQQLESENIYLQKEVRLLAENNIVGQSAVMKTVLAQAEQVAKTDSTVLILGETGTGKELLARAIHDMSVRKGRSLVTVNCASLAPTLMESELFGREKGAYTGAMTRMAGRFEVADGSTLFLDEIGELPLELQAKLLRVLEEGIFERLGSTRPIHANVRLIAATNRDLAEDVKEGRFRKDLYYRLNVFPIRIPSLRERPEDIPPMVWEFVSQLQERMGKRIDSIAKKSIEALQSYPWPGNVRELKNVIERAMILSRTEILQVTPPRITDADRSLEQNLEDVERRHILSVLERTNWQVTGKDSAAEILGLKRSTLQSRMKKLAIKRPSR